MAANPAGGGRVRTNVLHSQLEVTLVGEFPPARSPSAYIPLGQIERWIGTYRVERRVLVLAYSLDNIILSVDLGIRSRGV